MTPAAATRCVAAQTNLYAAMVEAQWLRVVHYPPDLRGLVDDLYERCAQGYRIARTTHTILTREPGRPAPVLPTWSRSGWGHWPTSPTIPTLGRPPTPAPP